MSRLLLMLLPLLFGCGTKETATSGNPFRTKATPGNSTPEYQGDNGAVRVYVQNPTNGKTVMRGRFYKGDSITDSYIFELRECAVFSSDSWRCISEGGSVTVDGGKLIHTYSNDEKFTFTRVRP